jgi:hypothetical protein
MTGNDGSMFRDELRDSLPQLLRRALASYTSFVALPSPEDAKSFAAYQASCRAAIAHVQMLLKLLEWTRSDGGGSAELAWDEDIEELVGEAERALAAGDPEAQDAEA